MSADVQAIRLGARIEIRETGEHPKLLFVLDVALDRLEIQRRGRVFFLSFERLRDEIDREYRVDYVEPRGP